MYRALLRAAEANARLPDNHIVNRGIFMDNKSIIHRISSIGSCLLHVAAVVFSIVWILILLLMLLIGGSASIGKGTSAAKSYDILNRYDNFINNAVSNAAEDFIYIKKYYELSDFDQVAPRPNQDLYGKAADPKDLAPVIESAQELLNGQDLLFTTEAPIMEDSEITYYLDDTILAITWKQPMENVVYTISEVKIAHPSQFRRFLADGVFGSEKQYLTSQMATSVNAVVASAGDFYKYRRSGIVVYNNEIARFNVNRLDTCFIDDQGDLLFTEAEYFQTEEQLDAYLKEHNVRFSLSFGPVLNQNGEICVPPSYPIGEIGMGFSRAAICQLDDLHYLIIAANGERTYGRYPTLKSFATVIKSLGVDTAYTIDGGQTATIVMNNKVINRVSYGAERYISDIFYFATAIPDNE